MVTSTPDEALRMAVAGEIRRVLDQLTEPGVRSLDEMANEITEAVVRTLVGEGGSIASLASRDREGPIASRPADAGDLLEVTRDLLGALLTTMNKEGEKWLVRKDSHRAFGQTVSSLAALWLHLDGGDN